LKHQNSTPYSSRSSLKPIVPAIDSTGIAKHYFTSSKSSSFSTKSFKRHR
ncbi:unnamed protein product, partial [Adineta steineri]